MSSIVESTIKRVDPEAIVAGSYYDQASGRLVLTVVKGPRKTLMLLPGRWFEDGQLDRLNRAIEAGVNRLQHTPIG